MTAQAVQVEAQTRVQQLYEEVYNRRFEECMAKCARGWWFCLQLCDYSARLEAAEVLGPEAVEKVKREAFVWR